MGGSHLDRDRLAFESHSSRTHAGGAGGAADLGAGRRATRDVGDESSERSNVSLLADEGNGRRSYGVCRAACDDWWTKVHPDDSLRLQRESADAMERLTTFETEFRVVWPDGTVRWLLPKGKIVRDGEKRPIRAAGVAMDITARHQAEDDGRNCYTRRSVGSRRCAKSRRNSYKARSWPV